MIADPVGDRAFTSTSYTTRWGWDTTTFYLSAPVSYASCYIPDPGPSKKELARRWWKYVAGFTPKLEEVLARMIQIVRKVQLPRLHHERQYPRVIKYRNNRMP